MYVTENFLSRTIQVGPEFHPSGDTERDIQAVMQYYRQFTGRNPHLQS